MSNFLTYGRITGGFSGTAPDLWTASTDDNLATITAAGYMNDLAADGITKVNDVWYVNYDIDGTPGSNEYTVEFSSPNYSLVAASAQAGTVVQTGASVSGNFPEYNNTTGGVTDSGISPSDGTKTKVVMAGGATVVGTVPKFTDVAGTIDDGFVPTNAAATQVVTATGAAASYTANHLLKAGDTNGSVADGGATLLWGTTLAYGGGGTSNAFVATGLTAASFVTANILASTNSVSITKAVPSANTLTITFSADPGAGTTVTWHALTV